jgi:EmrB/QacA subfamily drug resistance transporter
MNRSSIASHGSKTQWAALALIVAAQFMVVLDMSIVNVALASIKSNLHFSQASLQWVITAYAITFGGFLLLGGRLADVLGRRRIFLTGIALFTVGSALSGLAWSAASLVVFRALQGAGGALFAPAGLSLLMTAYREGRERNLALGIWGAASGSGAAVGVLLGGVLTSYLSWPWIFYINLPVGIALIVLVPRFIAEARGEFATRHFDVAGATTITASLMLLVYALTRATQEGWGTPTTVTLLIAAGGLGAAFVVIERSATSPLLPFHAFRGNTLGVANVITCLIAAIGFSQFFLLTLYLQQVLHYSAAESGVAFAAIAVTVAIMSNVAQRLVTTFGARRVLAAGLVSMAASQALLVRLPVHGSYLIDLLPSFILVGIGMAVSFVAVTIAALEGVQPANAGIASGLVNTSRQVGGAIGLAAITTVATTFASHAAATSSAAAAATHGYRVAFGVLTLLALVGAALTPTMRAHTGEVIERAPDALPAWEEAA